jgi:hypothetical protein
MEQLKLQSEVMPQADQNHNLSKMSKHGRSSSNFLQAEKPGQLVNEQ